MKILNKILFLLVLSILTMSSAWSASDHVYAKNQFGKVNIELKNKASLQRGAKYFVNYCLSCHPAQHSRYKRVADDLRISEDLMIDNMIFTGQKFGELMTVAMKREDAQKWFLGVDPPDLSTHVRAIGPQAVYEYLKTFYADDQRPFGVNNLYLPNSAMPHVLIGLQGLQQANFHASQDSNGSEHKEFEKFGMIKQGSLSEQEYEQVVTDIVNFLAYLSEPAQLIRKNVGVGVLFFLGILGMLAYFLKRNYWQDVH
jgi:ubiquinol-cytochrome c reductase cytochrome c1 subunit